MVVILRATHMPVHAARALAASLLLAGVLSAQTSSDSITDLQQRLAVYRHLLSDWAGLNRYGSENTEVPPPAPGDERVVFIGDEITEFWGLGPSKFFPGKRYLNRGIAGQTTAQMLVRFRQDVIGLKPRVVVIQGGSEDLASVFSPGTEATMGENITSMVELAKVNGIRVVLASITPVCDCFIDQTTFRPQGKIIGLNGWLKEYAAKSGAVYLDFYSALALGRDLRKAFTADGLLPNDNGYAVMAPLAERAIAQALGH